MPKRTLANAPPRLPCGRELSIRCASKKPDRVVVLLGLASTTLGFRMNQRIQSVLLVARVCPASYRGGAAAAAAVAADHATTQFRLALMTCKMIQLLPLSKVPHAVIRFIPNKAKHCRQQLHKILCCSKAALIFAQLLSQRCVML